MLTYPPIIPATGGNVEQHRPVPPTPFAPRDYVDAVYRELLEKIQEGVPSSGSVRYDASQTLTDDQKAQARTNIGALASVSWGSITGTIASQTDLMALLAGYQPAGTYATLVDGLVPVANIPASVYDVLEYSASSAFPETGSAAKLYIATGNNSLWRWNGTAYVQMNSFTETLTGVQVNGTDLPISSGKVNVDLTGCADVLEYANQAAFPAAGASGKIYVALDVNGLFRWNGTAYVQLNASGISTVKVDGVALPVTDGAVDITGKQADIYVTAAADAVAMKIGTTTVGNVLRYWRDTNFTFAELEFLDDSGHDFAEGFAGTYAFSDTAGWTQTVAGGTGTVAFAKATGAVTLTDTVSGVTQSVTISPTYPSGSTSSSKADSFADEVPTTGHDTRLVSSGGVRDALDTIHKLYSQNSTAASKNALDIASNLALITALSGRTYTKTEEDGLLLAKQARLLAAGYPVDATVDTAVTSGSARLITSGAVYAALAALDIPTASGTLWAMTQVSSAGGTIGNREQAYCDSSVTGDFTLTIPTATNGYCREFGLSFTEGFEGTSLKIQDSNGTEPDVLAFTAEGWTEQTISSFLTDHMESGPAKCAFRFYECAPDLFSIVEYY